MISSILQEIVDAQDRKRAVALITSLDNNEQFLRFRDSLNHDDNLDSTVFNAFRADRSQVVEIDDSQYFIQIYNSPLRLMVVGAVHIAQPLIEMGQACGYDVTLIDPRRAFASEERFPDVELSNEWPDVALKNQGLDPRTAVVTLTHDPKLDEPALVVALESDVFYIGALGSRRTHKQRCERLLEAGITSDQLERIHAPIGLNISAQSPAEIAVAIIAEVTQTLRQGGAN